VNNQAQTAIAKRQQRLEKCGFQSLIEILQAERASRKVSRLAVKKADRVKEQIYTNLRVHLKSWNSVSLRKFQ